jgi:hypothetical protein
MQPGLPLIETRYSLTWAIFGTRISPTGVIFTAEHHSTSLLWFSIFFSVRCFSGPGQVSSISLLISSLVRSFVHPITVNNNNNNNNKCVEPSHCIGLSIRSAGRQTRRHLWNYNLMC